MADNFDELLEKLENELNASETVWNGRVAELSKRMRETDLRKTPDLQAEIVSLRQVIIDEIKANSYRILKSLPKLKEQQKKQFEFFTTGYKIPVKHSTDKRMLMDAALAKHQHKIDLYENHIQFLRDTGKNLDNLHYAIKNKIEIMNIMGLDG